MSGWKAVLSFADIPNVLKISRQKSISKITDNTEARNDNNIAKDLGKGSHVIRRRQLNVFFAGISIYSLRRELNLAPHPTKNAKKKSVVVSCLTFNLSPFPR